VVPQSSAVPVRRIITTSDIEDYSKRSYQEQRDLQNQMAAIENQAAINARLDRTGADFQDRGDGALTVWPPDTNDIDLIANYLRELHRELERVNANRSERAQIRLRIAVTAGIVEKAAYGFPGKAAIAAALLVDCEPLKRALRNASGHSLAVMIDDALYQAVVTTGYLGLQPEAYRRVVVMDKRGEGHMAWITVPDAPTQTFHASFSGPAEVAVGPAQAGAVPAGKKRKKINKGTVTIAVALITAFSAITTTLITTLASGSTASPPNQAPSPPSPTIGITSASGTASPTGIASSPSVSAITDVSPDKLYTEEAYNHLGTDVYSDQFGDAVVSGPVSISFGTYVKVQCWARNESGMGSINAFYRVETPPWKGEYAPANTFLNADTPTALDPHVPECPGM
jgi:hypothetical protein